MPPTPTPFSYFDVPTAAPLGIAELMPGARKLMDYASVTSGERVLILTEHVVLDDNPQMILPRRYTGGALNQE